MQITCKWQLTVFRLGWLESTSLWAEVRDRFGLCKYLTNPSREPSKQIPSEERAGEVQEVHNRSGGLHHNSWKHYTPPHGGQAQEKGENRNLKPENKRGSRHYSPTAPHEPKLNPAARNPANSCIIWSHSPINSPLRSSTLEHYLHINTGTLSRGWVGSWQRSLSKCKVFSEAITIIAQQRPYGPCDKGKLCPTGSNSCWKKWLEQKKKKKSLVAGWRDYSLWNILYTPMHVFSLVFFNSPNTCRLIIWKTLLTIGVNGFLSLYVTLPSASDWCLKID